MLAIQSLPFVCQSCVGVYVQIQKRERGEQLLDCRLASMRQLPALKRDLQRNVHIPSILTRMEICVTDVGKRSEFELLCRKMSVVGYTVDLCNCDEPIGKKRGNLMFVFFTAFSVSSLFSKRELGCEGKHLIKLWNLITEF